MLFGIRRWTVAAPIGIILAGHVLRLLSPSFHACDGEPILFFVVGECLFEFDSIQNFEINIHQTHRHCASSAEQGVRP